jgi:hypothetical protein
MPAEPHSQAMDWRWSCQRRVEGELGGRGTADGKVLLAVRDYRHPALPALADAVLARNLPAAGMERRTEPVHRPEAARKLPLPVYPAEELGLEPAVVMAPALMEAQ